MELNLSNRLSSFIDRHVIVVPSGHFDPESGPSPLDLDEEYIGPEWVAQVIDMDTPPFMTNMNYFEQMGM